MARFNLEAALRRYDLEQQIGERMTSRRKEPKMAKDDVTVTFTRAQAEAVNAALAYFTSGDPDDVSTTRRVFDAAGRAQVRVLKALDEN